MLELSASLRAIATAAEDAAPAFMCGAKVNHNEIRNRRMIGFPVMILR
jgi:hypothetical protein